MGQAPPGPLPPAQRLHFNAHFAGGDDTLDLVEVRAAAALADAPQLPRRLVAVEPLHDASASTRRLVLSGSTRINGRRMDASCIDAVVPLGRTEIWEVSNRGNTPHTSTSTTSGSAFSNTPASTRFSDYGDPEVPYMFHCHILEHEDRGMMGQFVTVRPQQAVPSAGARREP